MSEYRTLAAKRLPPRLFDYIDGGAGDEVTKDANMADLRAIRIRQSVMRDVSVRDTSTTVLGQHLALPVVLGPVGFAGMFARRGEVQAARAAEHAGIPFTAAARAICSIEEVAAATTRCWCQLYMTRDRLLTEDLLRRASAVNASVLILNADLAVAGSHRRDTRDALSAASTVRARLARAVEHALHPRWTMSVALRGRPLEFGNIGQGPETAGLPAGARARADPAFDPSVTWDDIEWVRDRWDGRIVVKGIMSPEDARRAVAAGVDGVVVSNHGGRQLDSVPSTRQVLPAVAAAVGDEIEVLVDGGARSGYDVVKLLALGARAVLLGRAWVWPLAAEGEHGVRSVLEAFASDIDVAMALTARTSIDAIDDTALVFNNS